MQDVFIIIAYLKIALMGRVDRNGRSREPQMVGLRHRFPFEEHPGAADPKEKSLSK